MIVFARPPRLGAVKRRLARGAGARAALRFYAANLARLLRVLRRDRRFRTVLAAAGPWRPWRRWPAVAQGPGDIGKRMHRVFRRFPRGRVALVGSDIPDMTAADVAAAFAGLGRTPAVFGPAADGGYWLVAMAPRRPAHPFANVRWSGPHALADTLRNFRHHRTSLLRELRDIDTVEDLAAWHP